MEIQSFQNNGNHQEQQGQIRCCKKAFKKKKRFWGEKKWTHEIKSPDASPTDHDFQLLNTKLNSETHK